MVDFLWVRERWHFHGILCIPYISKYLRAQHKWHERVTSPITEQRSTARQLLTTAWQWRETASLMKYQEEFKESPCELFKHELEQDSSAHSCDFSDKSYLLNASSQEVGFTFILNVKQSGDIMNFWQSCNSAENSYFSFCFFYSQNTIWRWGHWRTFLLLWFRLNINGKWKWFGIDFLQNCFLPQCWYFASQVMLIFS